MKKRDLDNKTLDSIGRKLIERANPRSNDIEKIISNPHLFSSVRNRIAANGSPSLNEQTDSLALLFIRRNTAAFAVGVLILSIATIALRVFRSENTFLAVTKVQVPDVIPEVARPEVPPDPFVGKLSAGRAFDIEIPAEKSVVRTAVKKVERPPAHKTHEPVGEFYALSTAYGQDETAGGGRIIRVDVPRSSLFALGVNIPLENDAEVVKADLLIGSDGMTHAIRVVK